MERDSKIHVVTYFCFAGLVSAAITLPFLELFPTRPFPGMLDFGIIELLFDLATAAVSPGMPFAVAMLLVGSVVVKRRSVQLKYPPELWEVIVATLVVAATYPAGTSSILGMPFAFIAVEQPSIEPFMALSVAGDVFLSGLTATLSGLLAVLLITDWVLPRRILIPGVGIPLTFTVFYVLTSPPPKSPFPVADPSLLLVVGPVFGALIGYWFFEAAEAATAGEDL